MSVFVVVALALAVVGAGVAVVAGLQTRAAVMSLVRAAMDALVALRPLARELGEEVEVAGRELEALTTRQKGTSGRPTSAYTGSR